MSQYARDGGAGQVATIAIIIAVLVNSAVKAGMAALGNSDYRRMMLAATALLAAAGGVVIALKLSMA